MRQEKMPTWGGKFVTMSGWVELVKLVLASQSIYHLIPLDVSKGTLKFINKAEWAYLW
jgi:hypothetical protein